MRLRIFPIAISIFLAFVLFRQLERSHIEPEIIENKVTAEVHRKLSSLQTPSRVEVRNYIKDEKHKYQNDVKAIKKLKTKLDPKSKIYIELNLFVNESDVDAPLIAQFLIFDENTQNLIQEDNLALSH